ncbi:hypothetical protein F5146DRAFT_1145622 [Armillaria mellea]|nr:hypothetical protein F5146DRAFT_1145622 [Armillaria mellea]
MVPWYTFAHLPIQHAILVASGHNDTPEALESVSLRASEFPEVRWTCTLEMLLAAPKLHSMSLVCLFSDDLPWDQLVNLKIGKLRFPDLVFILNESPRLRCLCLPNMVRYLDSEGGTVQQPLSIITLQALESLDIYDAALLPNLQASPRELKVLDWLQVNPDQDHNKFKIICDFLTTSPANQMFTITTYSLDLFHMKEF